MYSTISDVHRSNSHHRNDVDTIYVLWVHPIRHCCAVECHPILNRILHVDAAAADDDDGGDDGSFDYYDVAAAADYDAHADDDGGGGVDPLRQYSSMHSTASMVFEQHQIDCHSY